MFCFPESLRPRDENQPTPIETHFETKHSCVAEIMNSSKVIAFLLEVYNASRQAVDEWQLFRLKQKCLCGYFIFTLTKHENNNTA